MELCGLLYEPDAGSKKVLVHVHGMCGNFYENKFLDNIAKTLSDNGVAFFAFSNRGTEFVKDLYQVVDGERTVVRKGDTYEKFEDCVLDIRAAIDFVESKGFTDTHLSGHSLGGPKVAHYAATSGETRLASVIFLSPADMVGLARADKNFDRDISTARQFIAEGNGNQILPFDVWGDCILSAESYINLTDKNGPVAIFNFYKPEDRLEVLSAITIPCTTILGRKDHVLNVPIEEFMERIEKALTASPRVETIILGDANHGFIGHEQQLADALNSWVQRN